MVKKVAFKTFGCKLNQCETVALEESLPKDLYQIVDFKEQADFYIINTCTVTAKADLHARQAIHQAFRRAPQAKIIVTGCYAEIDPETIAEEAGVNFVLGNAEKANLKTILENCLGEKEKLSKPIIKVSKIQKEFGNYSIKGFSNYTRVFLKIQEGCDSSCTYCIIPKARGKNRSQPLELVLQQVKNSIQNGFQEVVFCGIHLGTYGIDQNPPIGADVPRNLANLIKELGKIEALRRFRLSSIEPLEFTPELINSLTNNPKFCRHLHIPMQSGDDTILNLMHRNYKSADYAALILELSQKIPGICIGADVIVGFPGETDQHFQNTYQFVASLPLTYLHVFSFSARPGTPASDMNNQVDPASKKQRSEILRNLGQKKRLAFKERFLDQPLETLILGKRDSETGLLRGLTDNYLPVLIEGSDQLMNTLVIAVPYQIKESRMFSKIK